MKKLYEQADGLAKELRIIAGNLNEYNPGSCKRKVPLRVVQHNIASLMRELSVLYTDIGEKVKDEL